jgi:hypothetical protein
VAEFEPFAADVECEPVLIGDVGVDVVGRPAHVLEPELDLVDVLLEADRPQVPVEARDDVGVGDDARPCTVLRGFREPRRVAHAVVDVPMRVDQRVQRCVRVCAHLLVDVRTDLDDAAVDHHDPVVGDE